MCYRAMKISYSIYFKHISNWNTILTLTLYTFAIWINIPSINPITFLINTKTSRSFNQVLIDWTPTFIITICPSTFYIFIWLLIQAAIFLIWYRWFLLLLFNWSCLNIKRWQRISTVLFDFWIFIFLFFNFLFFGVFIFHRFFFIQLF